MANTKKIDEQVEEIVKTKEAVNVRALLLGSDIGEIKRMDSPLNKINSVSVESGLEKYDEARIKEQANAIASAMTSNK